MGRPRKHAVRLLVFSKPALAERFHRLRSKLIKFSKIAEMANELGIYHEKQRFVWTAESVRKFYTRNHPNPTTKKPSYHADRPRKRADCGTQRPCPWATCRYHMAGHVLSAAERSFRNPDNRKIPVAWGAQIEAGDFSMMPFTCVLDLIESKGRAHEHALLYNPILEGEAIGDYLGLSRELVRLETRKAIGKVAQVDAEFASWLADAYEQSKSGAKQ